MTATQVIYRGRVQGVGFRYTCRQLAGRHEVTGFVRNRADGTVELGVQGAAAEVRAFLEDVDEHLGATIRERTVRSLTPDRHWDDFTIRF